MSPTGSKVVLIDGLRTPFGKFGGSLQAINPVDLSVIPSQALLEKHRIDPSDVGQVLFGNVVPSSTDTMYAGRHVALKIGCPQSTPGYVINRLCGSGIQAITSAVQLVQLGRAELVLATGSENMSMIPHLLYGARFGTKYGALKSVDMLLEALTDQYTGIPMGLTAEKLGEQFKLSRSECDQFAFDSHRKAAQAYREEKMQPELVPVPLRKGILERDEHLRMDVSLEDMQGLRANFKKDGLVTPASASGIVDGAASTLIASAEYCERKGITPLCEILDYSVVGVDPSIMGIGPSPAIKQLLERTKTSLDEIDLIEINEAFAAQSLACIHDLNLDPQKVNIWGGAIALGHPLGASGTRISLSLARQLKDQNKKLGIASACIGGGQGIAVMLKSI